MCKKNCCKKSCCKPKSCCDYKPKCCDYKPKCEKKCYVKCYTCYESKPCGCRTLYDSNMGCKRNVGCVLNSSRVYTTKEKYITHYHLKDVDHGCDD